jgi:PfaB family protein
MCADGMAGRDAVEIAGLAEVYRGPERTCAAGSAKGTLGHAGAASGMAALVQAVLCLRGRHLSGFPRWTGPGEPGLWAESGLYIPEAPRPWLVRRGARRLAAVSVLSTDGVAAHLVLSEGTPPPPRATTLPLRAPLRLLPLAAADSSGILASLGELERRLAGGGALDEIAASLHDSYLPAAEAPLALALVAGSAEEALREARLAMRGVADAAAGGGSWETPAGSCFAARPAGREGGVAMVYPGAFSAYPGLGRDLMQLFPSLHDEEARRVVDPGAALAERLVHPRFLAPPSEAELEGAKRALRDDAIAMMLATTSFGVLATAVLRDHLGVRPEAAFGYSMGEPTMLWAMGVWRDADQGARRLRRSPLFADRLSGECAAAREALGLPAGPAGAWASWVVAAPPEAVLERLRGESRVFLTHIHTLGEVVIAGAAADVARVARDLGCDAFPMPFTAAIHCEAIAGEEQALRELHRFATHDVPGVRFYGAAEKAPTTLDAERLARSIARAVCQRVDFPRLVQRVWDDGVRVFVEPGPGATCSRWIGEILAGRSHAVVPLNRRGVDDATALLRAAARLVAHRVPLDLSALRPPREEAAAGAPRAATVVRTVAVGGRPMVPALAPELASLLRARPAPAPPPLLAAMPAGPIPVPAPTPAPRLAPLPESEVMLAPATHGELLAARMEELRGLASLPAPRPALQPATRAGGVVWDEAVLLEFAAGEIGRALGSEYREIDRYRRRVRLPMPPYLLVSRVTKLDAERGRFRPSSITTEYDVPRGAWYSVDGQVPTAVAVESGQCDLLLISYLGIDFECRGERVYRLLDCTLTFLDELPCEGDTLRYDIRIDSFARSGDTLLFFFQYDCYVGERRILEMRGGCAGFFSDLELERGRGVVDSPADLAARAAAVPRHFTPPLPSPRRAFDRADLLRLVRGELAACLGPAHDTGGRNPSLRLPPEPMLMLDRIVEVDPRGGAWGLGLLVAEKDLRPDDWYFPCHFQDDQVMAGSLMSEGCGQLLQFYLLYLGLHAHTFDARFQPVPGIPQAVVCRGQVTPTTGTLVFRMEVTDLGTAPRPFARANVDILLGGKVVVRFRDLALQLSEKDPRLVPEPSPSPVRADAPLYDERQVTEFAIGSLEACFGADCAVYEGRRAPRTPNGDLQLISRVVAAEGTRREPRPGSWLESEYDVPLDAWFCRENSYPTAPYSVLMEIGLQPCGFLSAHLGSTLADPYADLYFRNLDGTGRLLREVDVRGRTIRNRATLLSSTSLPGVIIQKFEYALECGGERFFEGEAVFGYFTGEALSKQTGLDRGEHVPAWLRAAGTGAALQPMELDPRSAPLFRAQPGRPHERLAGGRLHFLDHAVWSPDGGCHGRGYVHAERRVDTRDWYFSCHFFMDPVMPGSLGLEAMLEAVQAWTLAAGLTRTFRSPRFGPAEHEMTWKYRGQIIEGVDTLALEVHVARVDQRAGEVVVIADGSLWRDGLRIYEVSGLAVRVTEAAP